MDRRDAETMAAGLHSTFASGGERCDRSSREGRLLGLQTGRIHHTLIKIISWKYAYPSFQAADSPKRAAWVHLGCVTAASRHINDVCGEGVGCGPRDGETAGCRVFLGLMNLFRPVQGDKSRDRNHRRH